MRIALATCRDLPGWEIDDGPLHAALEARGIRFDHTVWNDPDVDWASYDACLIRTTWDYCDDQVAFVAWADRAAGLTRLMNGADVVRWNTRKSYLRDLGRLGAPLIPTLWLAAGDGCDLGAELARRGWPRAFIKPLVGATARETLRFAADAGGLAEAQAHVARLLPHEDLMVQPYLESVESFGEVSAIYIDGQLSHAVRKIPVAGDYRVQDDHGASDEPFVFDDATLRWMEAVARALPFDLVYARFDLLRDAAGAYRITELELVEPSLFFRHDPTAGDRLADAVMRRIAEG